MPASVCWRSCSLFSLAVAVRTYELVSVPNWSRWADPDIREQKEPAKPKKKSKKPKISTECSICLGQPDFIELFVFLVFLGLAGVFAHVFRRRLGFFGFLGLAGVFADAIGWPLVCSWGGRTASPFFFKPDSL